MNQELRSHLATAADQIATVLWHPELHKQVAREQLAYISVGFRPRYQRDVALQIIDRGLAEVGIRSYSVWELQRKPDVLIKVWMPAGKNPDDVAASLRAQAEYQPRIHLDLSIDTFQVTTMLSHHLWPHALTATDIDDALLRGGDHLTSGAIIGPLSADLADLERRQTIAPLHVDASGIKFFIWIALAELLPNERARTTLERELVRIVNSAQFVYATSVYRGSGSSANYIVTGRFKPEHYEILARDLQPRLADLGEPFIATNTDTALSTLFGPIDRVEALLPADDEGVAAGDSFRSNAPVTDLAAFLDQDESSELEFKGSAFNAIDGASAIDASDAERAGRTKKVRDAIVKSCAGFLNSSGGTLVIGVVEADRVSLEVAKTYRRDAVQVGKYVVVGVDGSLDGRKLTWDDFERRLRTLLSESISPQPDPWIEIVRMQYGELSAAAVIVREPNTWYWAKTSSESDVFYARYGNITRPLRGPAQHTHMKSRQRD